MCISSTLQVWGAYSNYCQIIHTNVSLDELYNTTSWSTPPGKRELLEALIGWKSPTTSLSRYEVFLLLKIWNSFHGAARQRRSRFQLHKEESTRRIVTCRNLPQLPSQHWAQPWYQRFDTTVWLHWLHGYIHCPRIVFQETWSKWLSRRQKI